MDYKRQIMSAVGLGIMLVLAYGSGDTSTLTDAPIERGHLPAGKLGTDDSAVEKTCLEVLKAVSRSDEFARYIVGVVKNNCAKRYSYVQVSFNLYDREGNQVGSTFANLNNFEPYGTWKFKAIILEDSATRFKEKEVTGF